MADSDVSKWAGVGMAALAAFGGYVGSVSSRSEEDGAMKKTVETLATALRDHDVREREFETIIRNQLTDIEARVRVLESRR